jgi:hypothetical protein
VSFLGSVNRLVNSVFKCASRFEDSRNAEEPVFVIRVASVAEEQAQICWRLYIFRGILRFLCSL